MAQGKEVLNTLLAKAPEETVSHAIESILSEVEAALAARVSYENIVKALAEANIVETNVATFKTTLYRLRKKRSARQHQSSTLVTVNHTDHDLAEPADLSKAESSPKPASLPDEAIPNPEAMHPQSRKPAAKSNPAQNSTGLNENSSTEAPTISPTPPTSTISWWQQQRQRDIKKLFHEGE